MASSGRREITALRLAAQRIARPDLDSPAEVVGWMLAMQAQDYAGAKWSIGLRSTSITDAAVEKAIADREIVRSWPLRGTLHFVAARDLHWMLDIARPRQATFAAKRRRDLEISDRQLAQASDVTAGLLAEVGIVRRDELLAAIERDGIATDAQRGYHLLWNMAHAGLIVFGPPEGKQPTFALLDEWVPDPRRLDRDEALGEFAARYCASHGPATERDLAWWASITLGDARRGIAIAGLESRDIDGTQYFHSPAREPASSGVYALSGFDEYMLGYQNRSAGLSPDIAGRIVPGNNGVFLPTLVVDGQVVATWKRTERATKISAELVAFGPETGRMTAGFAREMKRYSAFIGKPVEVVPATR